MPSAMYSVFRTDRSYACICVLLIFLPTHNLAICEVFLLKQSALPAFLKEGRRVSGRSDESDDQKGRHHPGKRRRKSGNKPHGLQ